MGVYEIALAFAHSLGVGAGVTFGSEISSFSVSGDGTWTSGMVLSSGVGVGVTGCTTGGVTTGVTGGVIVG